MSSTIGLNICAIIASIKKCKSIKKKKKHYEILLLAKANLDWIKGSVSKSLANLYIQCDYFNRCDKRIWWHESKNQLT